ncbi:MAG: zinc-ribbon domain-containing protein [Lachnospiraceae bacterium]|nr:zinc-ribbon domain-containing protein [Lachnospiraceae bacterium]
MPNYCPNCGSALGANVRFCPGCGAPVASDGVAKSQAETPVIQPAPPVYAGNGEVRTGIPAPGFSDRVNHPEILAALKKNRKAAGVFGFILVPLPLLGFIIYSLVSGQMELGQAAMIGGIISAVFLLFAIIGAVKSRAENTYEATVVDKQTHLTYRHSNSNDNNETITEYATIVRTTGGKTKRIVEQEGSRILAYRYLKVGDRFRYHPEFAFPYELYDKSQAPYIACVSCGTQNPVEGDRCKKCGIPLLK